jgi:hypothetical protein
LQGFRAGNGEAEILHTVARTLIEYGNDGGIRELPARIAAHEKFQRYGIPVLVTCLPQVSIKHFTARDMISRGRQ